MFAAFLPKEFNFFDLFDKQVDYAVSAADCFSALIEAGVSEKSLKQIGDIEHQGDEICHTIFEHLNKTFITPFDREDIHALAKELGFPKDRKAPILLPDYRPEPYKGHFTFFECR